MSRLIASVVFLAASWCGLAAPAEWYKGVTHVHSLWSDGDVAPEWIADYYKHHGYHFVAFSEHNLLQENEKWIRIGGNSPLQPEHVADLQKLFGANWGEFRIGADGKPEAMRLRTFEELSKQFGEKGKFLLVPGEEMTAGSVNVHTNAINLVDPIRGIEGTNKSEVLRQQIAAVAAQSAKYNRPMFAHLNHINWSDGVTAEEMLEAPELQFFEVYNGHPGTHPWGRAKDGMPSYEETWDIVQSMRLNRDPNTPLLYAVATDDSHEYHQWGLGKVNPGRGFVMVYADKLTPDAVTRAMIAGQFYSSTGVLLDKVEKTDKELRITIKAQPGAHYRTRFIGARADFDAKSSPRVSPDGKPLPRSSQQYSADVGATLLETTDNPAIYPFKGDELYVRARIYSDLPQENPVEKDDLQTAWVQPVKP